MENSWTVDKPLIKRGFAYRKRKRLLAQEMLAIMSRDLSYVGDPNFGPLDYHTYGMTLGEMAEKFPYSSYDEYESALALLQANEHVWIGTLEEEDPYNPPEYLFSSSKGREALFEGYYEKENQKDSLERFELRTRWILPIASFLISLLALTISILNYLYPHK